MLKPHANGEALRRRPDDYGVHGNEVDFKMQWEPEAKQE
jgi:hypothetical protein